MHGRVLRKALDDCRDCLLEDIERQVCANLKVLLDVIPERAWPSAEFAHSAFRPPAAGGTCDKADGSLGRSKQTMQSMEDGSNACRALCHAATAPPVVASIPSILSTMPRPKAAITV